ncbi:hypothetical protein Moror_14595 [Moniliophthora roreri MCA 2997]|uniref:Uncharacterized protein n=1 Tax=Moniliophthora roreri (strain MCA 2997) TaxID=1381753 RepID=V2YNI5_MONRO|nr:hypothetical protein Moror_14595 [Moniliophthora roreri MCA 2997]
MSTVLRRSCQFLGVVTVLTLLFSGSSYRDVLFSSQYLLIDISSASEPIQSNTYHSQAPTWNLKTPPDPDATGNLIFDTAHSLLQNWPNTRYRNGHAVVPGAIPLGTLLYHGRHDPHFPNGSDWTSVDPEHSFLFCSHSCWHLTLVTTRPLNVLYFDGSSAVKMRGGSLDVQDLLLWGERKDDKAFSENERLAELCEWVKQKGLGLDGFVRMEMDFEVMLCDFSPKGGLETVSFIHLANGAPPSTTSPNFSAIQIEGSKEALAQSEVPLRNFELVHSTSQHNHFPGETRIHLDLTRMVTLYDTELAPSLIAPRAAAAKEHGRWGHRAALPGIDPANVLAFRKRVEEAVKLGNKPKTSGVDWATMMNVIVKRYGTRLETLRYLLEMKPVADDGSDLARKAFTQLDIMLTPYIPHDAPSLNETSGALAIYDLCSTSHTSYIGRRASRSMTKSERMLLSAIQETTKEICRILVASWERGASAGISPKYQAYGERIDDEKLIEIWRNDVIGLMDWLDWSIWAKCRPACGDEEQCYLPTWPFFGGPPPADVYIPDHMKPTKEQEEEWMKPKPRC